MSVSASHAGGTFQDEAQRVFGGAEEGTGLLSGLKMLDFSTFLPGSYCSLLLADLGMEVLKVEQPGQARRKDQGHFFALNRNKKSVTVDLAAEEGREIVYRLVDSYDVVLEAFKPGRMDRLGLGYGRLREKNPRVIFCSLSGYGQDGPYRDRSGHDLDFIALAGILDITGPRNGPPAIPGVQIGAIGGGGLAAAVAILAAVFRRERTGQGRFLDVSMLDGAISWLSIHAGRYFSGDPLPRRGEGLFNGGYACYQVYETADGRYMALAAVEERLWKAFCKTVGREDLIERQFVEAEQQPALIEEIQRVFGARTQAGWVECFKEVDVCCEPVLNMEEVFDHPQAIHRQMLQEMKHPAAGWVQQIGPPVKCPQSPPGLRTPPPALGEHTAEVLSGIGYSSAEIEHFRATKII